MASKKQQLKTDASGALTTKQDVAGYPIRIYPPTSNSPYHTVIYTMDGERKRTTGGRTAREAVAKAQQIVKILDADAGLAGSRVSGLLEAWADPDRPRRTAWSPKYEVGVDWLLRKYVVPTIGNVQCASLRREHVQRAVNSAPTSGEGARVKRLLVTALRWGYAHGYLTVPVERLVGDVHWSRRGVKQQVVVSEQGADVLWVPPDAIPTHEAVADLAAATALLDDAEWWWGLMPLFAAYSGLRLGELLALQAGDVDTRKRQVRVERQSVETGRERLITPPKRNKTRTTVYPARTPSTWWWDDGFELGQWMSKRVREVKAKQGGEGLLFPAPRGGVWSATNFYKRRFHPAADRAGWDRRRVKRGGQYRDQLVWTWHSLRHVFCSYLLWDLNAKPVDVSQAAGHASVEITLRVYASDAPGALERLTALSRAPRARR